MALAAGKAVLADAEKRYTAAAIPALEAAVEAQIADGSYDFELNLALLNLYQLHTDEAKEEVLVKVLAKALTALPNPDYQLCKAVTSKELSASASVQWLDGLADQLEMGEFQAFWRSAADGGDTEKPAIDLLKLKGFADAVRKHILGLVSITYQSIPAAALGDILQLQGAELDSAANASGITRKGDDFSVPLCAENQAKPTGSEENFSFKELAPAYELCVTQS